MRRGDVWTVQFNPIVGSEQGWIRPAVIVSNDLINAASPVVLVVPFTTHHSGERIYPTQIIVSPTETNGLSAASVALCEQMRAVSVRRLGRARRGVLSSAVLTYLERALSLALSLPPARP